MLSLVRLLVICVFMTLIQCGSKEKADVATLPPQEVSDLSVQEAQSRKARVSEVDYQVNVALTSNSPIFSGKTEINFNLSDAAKNLRLDFFEGQLTQLLVNGQTVSLTNKKKYWIDLPATALKVGKNKVSVEYTQAYSHQGQGLHQFKDPETKETFLYTQFETYNANRFMPCFDQPDLRATWSLTAEVPSHWQVISTTRESSIKTLSGKRKLWSFPVSDRISTYLFSLHAGPYKVWTDQYENIPLRLFVRPSLARYVNPADWFRWTKQGLKYFNDFFAYRYPFKKYDQVIVPEFNSGAMENVAAVTFSEAFVHRSAPTRPQLRRTASTLLHEMAHMWFGDIVTMKWWNNLWLNESFATFMASMALQDATEFKESWQDFYSSQKTSAYWEDGLVTTHPIEAPVHSVKDATATFDAITYSKGASVLKQLYAYMSPAAFRKGLQNYVKTYAFQNADLSEFIGKLQLETEKDLTLWSERWLKQSGADQLSVRWNCEGPRLKQVMLYSKPAGRADFRAQSLTLALVPANLRSLTTVPVELDRPEQAVNGDWECPAMIYPNYKDQAYAEVSLDPVSLKFAKGNVGLLTEPLLRTMVWNDLWQMVRKAEMPLRDYIEIVYNHFPQEEDDILLQQIVATISGRRYERQTILYYWPQNSDIQRQQRLVFLSKMEIQYFRRMHAAKPGSDQQKFWLDNYIAMASTPKAMAQLATWVQQGQIHPRLKLDIDRRWAIARQLARFAHPASVALVASLQKSDQSERGRKNALAIDAIRPVLPTKQKWIEVVTKTKPSVTFTEARAVLNALFPVEQEHLNQTFSDSFYSYLTKNGNAEPEIFVVAVAGELTPLNCQAAQSDQLSAFLNQKHRFAPSVKRRLKINLQEDERCQKIKSVSQF